MKRIVFIAFASLLSACSSDEGTGEGPRTGEPENPPAAVDDSFTAVEDEELEISSLLANDTHSNARITSIDTESEEGGEIIDNRNGTYSYIPARDFIGEDSFNYTICETGTSLCSSAKVEITVNDGGAPDATDDVFTTVESHQVKFDVLDNDDPLDEASITSIDDDGLSGTITLNSDGTITYTPASGFSGEDSFSYTICDDDEEAECSSATVTITVLEAIGFNIPNDLQSYYGDIPFSVDEDLNKEFITDLTVSEHSTILQYWQRHNYLYEADEDPNNEDNVILLYSGESRYWEEYTSGNNDHQPQTFNTEHVYPQSILTNDDAVTDLHHLRVADSEVNALRSNFPFTDGSGDYELINENSFYPGDEWKGDVARMLMYLNIRYNQNFQNVGSLELFLKWNAEDPVSEIEIQRNDVIESAQGNRNPFIDNPYLATLIWGGEAAQNKWE